MSKDPDSLDIEVQKDKEDEERILQVWRSFEQTAVKPFAELFEGPRMVEKILAEFQVECTTEILPELLRQSPTANDAELVGTLMARAEKDFKRVKEMLAGRIDRETGAAEALMDMGGTEGMYAQHQDMVSGLQTHWRLRKLLEPFINDLDNSSLADLEDIVIKADQTSLSSLLFIWGLQVDDAIGRPHVGFVDDEDMMSLLHDTIRQLGEGQSAAYQAMLKEARDVLLWLTQQEAALVVELLSTFATCALRMGSEVADEVFEDAECVRACHEALQKSLDGCGPASRLCKQAKKFAASKGWDRLPSITSDFVKKCKELAMAQNMYTFAGISSSPGFEALVDATTETARTSEEALMKELVDTMVIDIPQPREKARDWLKEYYRTNPGQPLKFAVLKETTAYKHMRLNLSLATAVASTSTSHKPVKSGDVSTKRASATDVAPSAKRAVANSNRASTPTSNQPTPQPCSHTKPHGTCIKPPVPVIGSNPPTTKAPVSALGAKLPLSGSGVKFPLSDIGAKDVPPVAGSLHMRDSARPSSSSSLSVVAVAASAGREGQRHQQPPPAPQQFQRLKESTKHLDTMLLAYSNRAPSAEAISELAKPIVDALLDVCDCCPSLAVDAQVLASSWGVNLRGATWQPNVGTAATLAGVLMPMTSQWNMLKHNATNPENKLQLPWRTGSQSVSHANASKHGTWHQVKQRYHSQIHDPGYFILLSGHTPFPFFALGKADDNHLHGKTQISCCVTSCKQRIKRDNLFIWTAGYYKAHNGRSSKSYGLNAVVCCSPQCAVSLAAASPEVRGITLEGLATPFPDTLQAPLPMTNRLKDLLKQPEAWPEPLKTQLSLYREDWIDTGFVEVDYGNVEDAEVEDDDLDGC